MSSPSSPLYNFAASNPPEGNRTAPRVSITVGSISVDDNAGKFIANANPSSIFTDYIINQRYEQDRHIYMLPIASPVCFLGGTAAFVQLAAPTLLRIVDWTAARMNQQPTIPNPASFDPDWILMDILPETAMITVAIDGVTPLYRISGTYVYGHRRPSDNPFNNISYARPPWLRDDFTFGRLQPSSTLQGNLSEVTGITGGIDGSVGGGATGGFNFGGTGPSLGCGGSVGGGAGGSFG